MTVEPGRTRLEVVRALRAALFRVCGAGGADDRLADYLALGLTIDHVDEVGRLVAHANALGSPAARDGSGAPLHAQLTALRLMETVLTAVDRGTDVAVVLDWAAVLVAEPDFERVEATLRDGLGVQALRWTNAGPHAALAYAAGLSLTEAEARHAAGTLDEAVLRALIALRGYRLPV